MYIYNLSNSSLMSATTTTVYYYSFNEVNRKVLLHMNTTCKSTEHVNSFLCSVTCINEGDMSQLFQSQISLLSKMQMRRLMNKSVITKE